MHDVNRLQRNSNQYKGYRYGNGQRPEEKIFQNIEKIKGPRLRIERNVEYKCAGQTVNDLSLDHHLTVGKEK